MGENLVIVESPSKAKTIEKFLGKGFLVKSSFGHIRDLSKKKLGIDTSNNFEPSYEISSDKKNIVQELKSLAKKANMVWLASDEDREGEAIAWHLQQTLNLDTAKTKRIVFHEITKDAILNAIKNPRTVDINLVMAQQARRVLDRLVGFELSPVLWKKVAPKLSAGRVQSVAVKLIVEREREIMNFTSTPYFKITGIFSPTKSSDKTKLKASVEKKIETLDIAKRLLEDCKSSLFSIEDIETKGSTRTPAPPFTTSALQQEASRKLGFSVAQTMRVAQQLYENGLITYMRTDSTNLSQLAINTIKDTIISHFGLEYSKPRQYKTKSKGAQEAHEAIRPTYSNNATIDGTPQEKKLYNLIWKRTIASQMADAKIEKTNITIAGSNIKEKFYSTGEKILFDGFLKLYLEGKDDEDTDDENQILPNLAIGEDLTRVEILATEKFSQRPPRYSEASLVKKLEELGIGRPSTYAPTITTITQRDYIAKEDRPGITREYKQLALKGASITESTLTETTGAEKGKLFPHNTGMLVTDFLQEHFANILDYGFTAKVEADFDKIAAGKMEWNKIIKSFYTPFHSTVEETLKDGNRTNIERFLGTDPISGQEIYVKNGRFGPYVQKGANDDPKKQNAKLPKEFLTESVTLQDALTLFKLPREIGEYNNETIVVSNGRFGPYIKYYNKFISLGKGYDPFTLTTNEAIVLIKENEIKESQKHIASFPEQDIQILNGRYGAYIKHNGENYKIPKDKEAKLLTLEECLQIISNQKTSNLKPKKGKK